jgi:predicted transposase YbfD/YdcC
MPFASPDVVEKSSLKLLLDHLGTIEDPREPWRVAFPLNEVLFLVVCGTICDCDNYELIADWGKSHLDFLRRYLPYHHGVPGERWLTILMNRLNPTLFSQAFSAWVQLVWPERIDQLAIDGKTSRRSHDKAEDRAPLHLVSAFASTSRLVLAQEAVPDKSGEGAAILLLLDRLGADNGLKDALVSIDAIATNATIASAIQATGANYLLAVKANQPTIRAEIESYFNQAPAKCLLHHDDLDKAHGRIEQRFVTVSAETDWLDGQRRFPGEYRLPGAKTIIRVRSRTELEDRCRFDTRFFISSASLTAAQAALAIRNHWQIENGLHWVLDVTFGEDQSRLRKGHGAKNMALVRHFAFNLLRQQPDKRSIKRRRKNAGWSTQYLETILGKLSR